MMFEEIIFITQKEHKQTNVRLFSFSFSFSFSFFLQKSCLEQHTKKKNTEHMPLESLPPFAIIVGAITAIGGIQYAAHVLPMGKPKAVGLDNFDRLLERRDQRIRERSGLQK